MTYNVLSGTLILYTTTTTTTSESLYYKMLTREFVHVRCVVCGNQFVG